MRITSNIISFHNKAMQKMRAVIASQPALHNAINVLKGYGPKFAQTIFNKNAPHIIWRTAGRGTRFIIRSFSEAFKDFSAPGMWRDLGYAVIASLAVWGIIFFFQANAQGFKVFRYMQF